MSISHSSAWIEAFGRNVLEALASGLPVILPASFKPLFREAAIYGEPADVQDILGKLQDNPANLEIQCDRARAAVSERFASDRFGERLRPCLDFDQIGPQLAADIERARAVSGRFLRLPTVSASGT